MTETIAEVSMFDRIGGAVAVDRLVEAFYGHMDKLPEAATIRAMHDADIGQIKVCSSAICRSGPAARSFIRRKRAIRACASATWAFRSTTTSATPGWPA